MIRTPRLRDARPHRYMADEDLAAAIRTCDRRLEINRWHTGTKARRAALVEEREIRKRAGTWGQA